jgi:hypothetical protein
MDGGNREPGFDNAKTFVIELRYGTLNWILFLLADPTRKLDTPPPEAELLTFGPICLEIPAPSVSDLKGKIAGIHRRSLHTGEFPLVKVLPSRGIQLHTNRHHGTTFPSSQTHTAVLLLHCRTKRSGTMQSLCRSASAYSLHLQTSSAYPAPPLTTA